MIAGRRLTLFDQARGVYAQFPPRFWVIVVASFIDVVGSSALFPFFALYVTSRFGVGMAVAGGLLAVVSLAGLVSNVIGGALTDRLGRRSLIVFGLVASAMSTLSLGVADNVSLLYGLSALVGLMGSIAGPAHQAALADILPEEKRADGFGVLRVAANLAWIIGPTIGGFVAARSYLLLFVLDCCISIVTAGLLFWLLPETKPEPAGTEEQESWVETVSGYGLVLRDRRYLLFMVASTVMLFAYQQVYSTLSVFMRDARGMAGSQYGFLLSLNAVLVVALQLWVTSRTKRHAPALMMALGSALYLVGLTAWGFVYSFWAFAVAMVLVTIGEMVVVPVSQSLVAAFSPELMRGRYAAVYGLSWGVASMLGPWAGGIILDSCDPNWAWYAAGIACGLALLGFLALQRMEDRTVSVPGPSAASPTAGRS